MEEPDEKCGKKPFKIPVTFENAAHRAKGGSASRGENVLWKIHKVPDILAEAIDRAVAVRGAPFAKRTYEEIPSQCLTANTPSSSFHLWGRLPFILSLSRSEAALPHSCLHACSSAMWGTSPGLGGFVSFSTWLRRWWAVNTGISQPEGAEGHCGYGLCHGEQAQFFWVM